MEYKLLQGQFLKNVGLKDELYFKYFNYPDFITPYSGIIQIKKHSQINNCSDLEIIFDEIFELTKKVKDKIYRLLIEEYEYFN